MISRDRNSVPFSPLSAVVEIYYTDYLECMQTPKLIKKSVILKNGSVLIQWLYFKTINKILNARIIQLTMKQSQESQKIQENFALINQEFLLVVEGKAADRLVKLLRNIETDPFSIRIEKVDGAIEKYALALLINSQYLDLTFLLLRYKKQIATQIKNFELLFKIGECGKKEDLKQLWQLIRIFITQNSSNPNLGQRVKESTIDYTVKVLSKYFLNFGIEDLNKLTGITEKDLVDRGVQIRGKYIQLKQQKVQTDCLQTKLKELAVVASKMSQFE